MTDSLLRDRDGSEDHAPHPRRDDDGLPLAVGDKLVLSAVEYQTPVGKSYRYTDGKLVKGYPDRPPEGVAIHREFDTFAEFVEWRRGLSSNTMLVSGTFEGPEVDGAPVLYKKRALQTPGAVSASKIWLAFRSKPGVLIIDIDFKIKDEVDGLYPEDIKPYKTHEAALEDLDKVLPEAVGCALLVTDSTSANIFDADGNWLKPAGGLRIYIPVTDASQTPRLLEIIHKRCWIQGLGWAFIDGGAGFQERSLADKALGRPTQPDYAAPGLQDGLDQDRRWREFEGDWLDPATVAPLTGEEEQVYLAEITGAKEALADSQTTAERAAKDRKVAELIENGVDGKRARKSVERLYERGVVTGADLIVFDGGKTVSAAQLVADGEKYDEERCHDPIEPAYDGGRLVGKFFWNEGMHPGVFSFAHGGRWFDCRHDVTSLGEIIETGDKDAIVAAMAHTEFADGLEEVEAEGLAARKLGIGNRREPLRRAVAGVRKRMARHACGRDSDGGNAADDALMEAGQWPFGMPLPRDRFPHSDADGKLLDHRDNLAFMLRAYGIDVGYDVISKTLEWSAPGLAADTDNADTVLFSQIKGLAALNGLPKGNESLHVHLPAIAEQRQINRVQEYLSGLSWDGRDRFRELAEALGAHDPAVAKIAIRRWLIEACAAADGAELAQKRDPTVRPVFEYVLVQVAVQGAGKTKGLSQIVPKALQVYLKESVVLAITNKDTVKQAVSCWIAELGELDATFKAADHVAFKAFMSRENDELRMPYAPAASRFRRRTVFFGSVNEDKFLKDKTGARRFYPLAVDRGFPAWRDEELDQLWAQAWSLYKDGEQWWPTHEEEALLASNAESFRQRSWEEECLEEEFDWGNGPNDRERMTASELWSKITNSRYGEKAATPKDLHNVAKAMERLWCDQGAYRKDGKLMLDTSEGPVQVHADGGKNHGWLVPKVKGPNFPEEKPQSKPEPFSP